MNTRLWIVLLIVVAWTCFLIGYSVSALTGVNQPTGGVTGAAGGYGAAAGGSKAAAGGYGAASADSEKRPGRKSSDDEVAE